MRIRVKGEKIHLMYAHVFVAGTFDGLHKGHRCMLSEALHQGEKVTIGLTTDEFVEKFKVQSPKCKARTYKERKKDLEQWLNRSNNHASIISISDPYEPAASATDVDALVVSAETRIRGEEINEKRKKRGLKELVLLEVPMVNAEDQRPISSSRVRFGEITTQGTLILPDNLRPQLRKPIGKLVNNEDVASAVRKSRGKIVIAVGDATTETLLNFGIIPNLAIIDLHINRKSHDTLAKVPETLLYYSMAVASGPGFISQAARRAIRAWATHCQPTLLIVKGEEDLLVLPAIIHAPYGSLVYYGQPREGIVEVVATKREKESMATLLKQFIS